MPILLCSRLTKRGGSKATFEIFYVAWERAYNTKAAGVFSEELFDGWNAWFISVAERDPVFVWPMVRDSQDWDPFFVQHVNKSLGYSKFDMEAD